MKNEKLIYTAPEAEIETIQSEDIVLISVHDEEYNLDEHAVNWADRDEW